ncbi:hypothetical protein PC129_g4092 [Phytophthora cactorum]|uniref:Uncharacterized protein n=1 Tax=Phytophthora cactorum TaxID=29920 RepID=A0A8T1IMD6_9STRA|nr:hypothetical protein PC112_g6041 [Phytophthora cactorum]KAG3225266.1 hypothetical protein PC129_g4092 [Phytophthora cactorum]
MLNRLGEGYAHVLFALLRVRRSHHRRDPHLGGDPSNLPLLNPTIAFGRGVFEAAIPLALTLPYLFSSNQFSPYVPQCLCLFDCPFVSCAYTARRYRDWGLFLPLHLNNARPKLEARAATQLQRQLAEDTARRNTPVRSLRTPTPQRTSSFPVQIYATNRKSAATATATNFQVKSRG